MIRDRRICVLYAADSIYAKVKYNSFHCNTLPKLCVIDEVFESVAVEIKMNMFDHTLSGVHRPPLSSLSLFNSNIFSILVIITGHVLSQEILMWTFALMYFPPLLLIL